MMLGMRDSLKLAIQLLRVLANDNVFVAMRLMDFFDRKSASEALIAMGPIAEKDEVVSGLANKDDGVRLATAGG